MDRRRQYTTFPRQPLHFANHSHLHWGFLKRSAPDQRYPSTQVLRPFGRVRYPSRSEYGKNLWLCTATQVSAVAYANRWRAVGRGAGGMVDYAGNGLLAQQRWLNELDAAGRLSRQSQRHVRETSRSINWYGYQTKHGTADAPRGRRTPSRGRLPVPFTTD